ncbi:MAG TPA: hypothetical protein VEK07_21005 [Polyangiaceae bacterium]|nr:hypothetical protein [Polyangiaceae bacterium]
MTRLAAIVGEAGPARGVDEAAEGAEAPRRRRRTRHRRSALRRWFRRYGRHLWIYAVAVFLSISVTYYLVR